ncbi:helix-turn-helix domain-containing protein [Rummeliibacillus suwonensis]|uniref:helix-turn-helix domain-containing protein n=1 Tax=Rummeliibacillus suwonensis TaxID=1306154 RepID=UPI0011B6B14D|nr:helix-turn-helix transcriptional regulator [Rummeliibacillus suwonensis]
MKPDKKEVGKRIRFIKEHHNPPISLTEFGQLLKDENGNSISKGTVDSWIRGLGIPSNSTIEKIAAIGSTTADWIYWGGLKKYIESYLKSKQEDAFLERFPDALDSLEETFKDGGYDDERLPSVKYIDEYFMKLYKFKFKKHIEDTIDPYTIQIPKYLFTGMYSEGSKELQMMKFKESVTLEVKLRQKNEKIDFEDTDLILQIAKEKFEAWVIQYKHNHVVGNPTEENGYKYFIKYTENEEGIRKIFSDLGLNTNELSNKKLIKAFVDLGKKLKKL